MSIEIDRLKLELAAATVPARAPLLERRVRNAIVRGLPPALEAVDRDDPELVFIDQLILQAQANSARDDDFIAGAVARALLVALDRTLAAPSSSVTRYADRSEWVAAFILALIDGNAWRDWRFDEFDGLRPLPLSAALRTLLINEAELGVPALLRLAPAERLRALRTLTRRDLSALVAAWTPRPGPRVRDAVRLLATARTLDGRLSDLVAAALDEEQAERGVLANALVLLAALADLWAARARWPASDDSVSARERLHALAAASAVDAEVFAQLDEDQCSALLTAAGAPASSDIRRGHRPSPPAADERTESTCYGGAFVLLAVLNWLDAPAQWRHLFTAAVGSDHATQLARSLALATAAVILRPRDPCTVLDDRALQRAIGVSDPLASLQAHLQPTLDALAATAPPATCARKTAETPDDASPAALMRALRRMAARLLARLRERVPGCTQATAAYLRRNLLSQSATMRCSDGGVAVRCSRAPLHVLLLIAGLASCRFDCAGIAIDVSTESAA